MAWSVGNLTQALRGSPRRRQTTFAILLLIGVFFMSVRYEKRLHAPPPAPTPREADSLYRAARTEFDAGHPGEAHKLIAEARKRDPRHAGMGALERAAAAQLEDLADDTESTRRALATETDGAARQALRRRLGRDLAAAGDYRGSIAAYREAIADAPAGCAECEDAIGSAHTRLGEHEDAVAAHERAVTLAPANPEYRARRDAARRTLATLQAARQALRERG